MAEAYLIEFQKIGNSQEGFLNIAAIGKEIPFDVKRIFWTSDTPENITRGRHAHFMTEMVLVAVNGQVDVSTENSLGLKHSFLLSSPYIGLYIPKMCWHEMKYSGNAVQLVMTSTQYDEADYIRDKNEFNKLILK
jgi:dTDP-4-dehydrorhamnose 3,5-epimerase-like enzyme